MNFQSIINTPQTEWKRKVTKEVEKKNTERLKKEHYKPDKGTLTLKTKTASIAKYLSEQSYNRKPQHEIINCTKYETKTLIIARYGKLECGTNYKGSMKEICE